VWHQYQSGFVIVGSGMQLTRQATNDRRKINPNPLFIYHQLTPPGVIRSLYPRNENFIEVGCDC